MFLKSLSVRGFKSFADKTTLVFEPGITVVVGPNGSGKSNIVDAISWVLGEQGPRALRGGKMEDVIFAGSRLRPALGMAEVTLTIDNSAQLLPIEFSEVTISRTLFRSGEAEYRLNGAPCRLLDIQEVLSDTGVGREQHTIIGQGQLDAILTADPAQIRAFIEEAAGIGKHRRRRDRALRKIASTEQNLVRLSDLLSEIRRQLRPLREQAEVAKKHSQMADELSRVKLIMAGRELAGLRGGLGPSGGLDIDALITAKEAELGRLETKLSDTERRLTELFRSSEAQREAAWSYSRVVERLSSLARLAEERHRTLEAELANTTKAAANARLQEAQRSVANLESGLADAAAAFESAERDLNLAKERKEAEFVSLRSAEADLSPLIAARREAVSETVRIRGELAALASTRESSEQERLRLSSRDRALAEQLESARERLFDSQSELEQLERQEAPLIEETRKLEEEIAGKRSARAALSEKLREAERNAARWLARAEIHGSEPQAARSIVGMKLEGVLGILGEMIETPEQHRAMLEALFGDPMGVVVASDAQAARRIIETAPEGSVGILIAASPGGPRVEGPRPLTNLIGFRSSDLAAALSGYYVAEGAEEATLLAAKYPHAVFSTPDGWVASGAFVVKGSREAAARAKEARDQIEALETELDLVDRETEGFRSTALSNERKMNDLDASVSATSERLTGAEREIHALEREIGAVGESASRAEANAAAIVTKLQNLESSLPEVEAAVRRQDAEVEQLQGAHARAVAAYESAATFLDEARNRFVAAEERKRLLTEQLNEFGRTIAEARAAASGVEGKRAFIERAKTAAEEVGNAASSIRLRALDWASDADAAYRQTREEMEAVEASVGELRAERAGLAGALDDLRVRARQEDLSRSEMKIRSRILEERMREEWRIDPDSAVERFGHHWDAEESRFEDPLEKLATYDDESLRRKHTRLERDLEQIGRVNPLAEQEFESLTSREEFLAAQIADVRSSRRDLFKIVASLDEQVRELFQQAYEDVSREYERLFVMLFPGGQGKLRLSDPSDLLTTGVEVEARPGGKNLKRLSLLSGGEKSLSAMAFLFAIFRARPSPFYILDEVEAALDDVNLHRFLGLLREFRDSSQLLVVTHQKRTMEAADVLYGVSIRPDGATRVISERLTQVSPAPESLRGRVGSEPQ